jgi:UPF0716 family protein affecting phage T7 exclusion
MWLFLLLIVAPLLELWVIIQVADVIGGWETMALLIIESAIGAWLLKAQGFVTLARMQQALAEGRVPNKEMVDGFLLLVAGALMLAPGFIGDLIGFALIIPFTRIPFRMVVLKRIEAGRFGSFFAATTSTTGATRFVGTFRAGPGGNVYDTTGSAAPDDRPSGELRP